MSVIPFPSAAPEDPAEHLQTEAQGLVDVLMDLGVTVAISFGQPDKILFQVDDDTKPGALAVAQIAERRFSESETFRDDAIGYVATFGHLLADAPGIMTSLKAAPVSIVVQALAMAGLLIRHHYERDDGLTPMLSFMPVSGRPIAPNAHMLMKLAADRFAEEPDFAKAMTQFVIAEGQSQHNA